MISQIEGSHTGNMPDITGDKKIQLKLPEVGKPGSHRRSQKENCIRLLHLQLVEAGRQGSGF